jgi:hypothetical protein
VKEANPALALFLSRDQHIEFLALSHLLLRECEDPFRKLAHRAYTLGAIRVAGGVGEWGAAALFARLFRSA